MTSAKMMVVGIKKFISVGGVKPMILSGLINKSDPLILQPNSISNSIFGFKYI